MALVTLVSEIMVNIYGAVYALILGGTRKKPVDKRLLSPLYHTICSFSRIVEDPKESDHKVK